jgi:integrase
MAKTDPNTQSQYVPIGERVSIYRRGRTWYVYYRADGEPRRASLKTHSVKEARRAALLLEADLNAGRTANKSAAALDEVIDEFLLSRRTLGRAPKTLGKYTFTLNLLKTVAAARGVTGIDGVDHRLVDAFSAVRAPKRSAKTLRNDLVVIRQLVKFAVSRGLTQDDTLRAMTYPKVVAQPQPFWTPDQVTKILAALLPRYLPYFTFLAETGARSGEAIWLRWEDVDFDNNVVHIRAKQGWQPKSGDERAVPLSSALRALLTEMRPSSDWVFIAPPSAKRQIAGRQIDGRRALAHLKTVLKRLDLDGHQHTFRHTFISHALTSGIPEAVVRQWVGHVDDKIIRRYTHIASRISQEQMARLGGSQSGGAPGSSEQNEAGLVRSFVRTD